MSNQCSPASAQCSAAEPQCRAAEWGWRFGDSSYCLDESSHRWVPARTPTVHRCPIVGRPWVARSRDQPVSRSSTHEMQKLFWQFSMFSSFFCLLFCTGVHNCALTQTTLKSPDARSWMIEWQRQVKCFRSDANRESQLLSRMA